jgi:flavin reductase (DIM6/NTAB) family NADH-FMN oxidoreductase RutF
MKIVMMILFVMFVIFSLTSAFVVPRMNAGGPSFALERLDEPPPLSTPVYSLATRNLADESTNMNIVTFVTPVSLRPQRIYALSLYKGTLSHENFIERGWGILQLMKQGHAPLVEILGKRSGRDMDKRGYSAAEGFIWVPVDEVWSPESIDLIPDAAAYLTLQMISFHDAGDHDVALCSLTHVSGLVGPNEDLSEDVLYTQHLRDVGLLAAPPISIKKD